MKINKVDFLLMYLLGAVLVFAFGIANALIPLLSDYPLLDLAGVVVLFLIPGLFYFSRNMTESKDSLLISYAYGFTIFPLYILLIIVPLAYFAGDLVSIPGYSNIFDFASQNWTDILFGLFTLGVILSLTTSISYFIIRFTRRPKEDDWDPEVFWNNQDNAKKPDKS